MLKNQHYSKYPGGNSKSQATGMTGKGFGGFEIFKSGIFLGRRFSQVFFGWLELSRDFFRYSKQSEDLCSAWESWPCSSMNKVKPYLFWKTLILCVILFNAFWKFSRCGNSEWDIYEANFYLRDLSGFVGSPRDFWGFDFCPHSIIPIIWNPEYTPLGPNRLYFTPQTGYCERFHSNEKNLKVTYHFISCKINIAWEDNEITEKRQQE